MAIDVRLKRAYEPPQQGDGHRVLVERLWPRGLTRDAARIDDWARELAPSDALRRWYRHDPERFEEFRRRYVSERALSGNDSRSSAGGRVWEGSRSSSPRGNHG